MEPSSSMKLETNTENETKENSERYFKERVPFELRKEECLEMRLKSPEKIPVIVERYRRERHLPKLDKCKYLVPNDATIGLCFADIRRRINIQPTESFFLIIGDNMLVPMSKPIIEVYNEYKDDDGLLYIKYASQEIFGSY